MPVSNDKTRSLEGVTVTEVHPLWVRWAHWINFPLLTIMMISGAMIYWANSVYTPFIPQSVYQYLGIKHLLALGLGLHFTFMWAFTVNGILYVAYLLLSGEWRELVPAKADFKDSVKVAAAEVGLGRMPDQRGKFNAAQRITYCTIIIMAGFSVLTGIAMYKPIQFSSVRQIFYDYSVARLLHFIFAVAFALFFFMHVAQVMRAGASKFKAMISGAEMNAKEIS